MTNLDKLLQNDDEVLTLVLDKIVNNFCIDTKTMRNVHGIRCENCPFSSRANDNVDCCEELQRAWLMEEYSEVSELAFIDKGTGTIVGGGPDE